MEAVAGRSWPENFVVHRRDVVARCCSEQTASRPGAAPAFEMKRQGSRQLRGVDKSSRSCCRKRSHAPRAQERIDARCPQRATPPSFASGLGIRHRTAATQRVPRTVVHTDAGLLEKARKTPEFGGFCDARAKTYDKTCPQASTAAAAAMGRRMRRADEQCIAGCSGHLSESVVTAMAAVLALPRGGWGFVHSVDATAAHARCLASGRRLRGAGRGRPGALVYLSTAVWHRPWSLARGSGVVHRRNYERGCVLATLSFGPAIPRGNGRICRSALYPHVAQSGDVAGLG